METASKLVAIVEEARNRYMSVVEKLADDYVDLASQKLKSFLKKCPDESDAKYFSVPIMCVNFGEESIFLSDSVHLEVEALPEDFVEAFDDNETMIFGGCSNCKWYTVDGITPFIKALEKRGFTVCVCVKGYDESLLYPFLKV